MENFVFLELSHKLSESHDFAFYRKKSGAEITFILTNKENTLITPIEVILRDSEVISQSMKAFDMKYHHRVEHYMLLNNTKSARKSLEDKTLMILPHIAL